MSSLLTVSDLTVEVIGDGDSARPVVKEVCFDLGVGEVMALVGESGSGKSLTALALVGLFGVNGLSTQLRARGRALYRPRNGEVVDLLSLTDAQRSRIRGREIGLIAQDPLTALNPVMSIGEQVREARRTHLSESVTAESRAVRALLEESGFTDPGDVTGRFPHQLSGGMRQRAMIAIALAAEPRLLIADEPTTALDVAVQAQVLDTLSRLQKRRGLSILFISHDLGLVSHFADRVAVMYCGTLVEQAGTAQLLSRPAHPYSAALLGSLPRLEPDARLPKPIPDYPADPLNPPSGCAFHPRCEFADPAQCSQLAPAARLLPGQRLLRCHVPLLMD
jgi:oligopeptide/dipeptide ABC transporter ATP-binding protein